MVEISKSLLLIVSWKGQSLPLLGAAMAAWTSPAALCAVWGFFFNQINSPGTMSSDFPELLAWSHEKVLSAHICALGTNPDKQACGFLHFFTSLTRDISPRLQTYSAGVCVTCTLWMWRWFTCGKSGVKMQGVSSLPSGSLTSKGEGFVWISRVHRSACRAPTSFWGKNSPSRPLQRPLNASLMQSMVQGFFFSSRVAVGQGCCKEFVSPLGLTSAVLDLGSCCELSWFVQTSPLSDVGCCC